MNTQIEKAAKALLAMQRHNWEQGTAMQAFLEMDDRETVIAMAHEAVYRSLPDGRLAMLSGENAATDPCSVGEALIRVYEWTGDEYFKKGIDGLLKWALHTAPRNEDGVVYHMIDGKEFWADSFYMLPPFLMAAGYFEEALLQFKGYWKALYDEEVHLLRHRWDDNTKKFINPAHWGTGNGWALAAMARMIPQLCAAGKSKDEEEMIVCAKELLDGVLDYMRPDGTFLNNVDEEDSFVEVNLSQMAAYTIYRGVHEKWLPQEYLEKADCMRMAAEDRCSEYGVIWDVCGAPSFEKTGCSPEAQAFFLLMETAHEKMRNDKRD